MPVTYASDIVGPRISLGGLWIWRVWAHELPRSQLQRASKRSVGEPAEGSLPREGLRAPGGFGLHLFTHCVPTFVALAGHGVRPTPAFALVSARQRPIKSCL